MSHPTSTPLYMYVCTCMYMYCICLHVPYMCMCGMMYMCMVVMHVYSCIYTIPSYVCRIEYHFLLGIDHFYIYDRDGSFATMLKPYECAGLVTRYEFPLLTPGE